MWVISAGMFPGLVRVCRHHHGSAKISGRFSLGSSGLSAAVWAPRSSWKAVVGVWSGLGWEKASRRLGGMLVQARREAVRPAASGRVNRKSGLLMTAGH